MSSQLWLHRSRAGGLAAAITGLAAPTQQPIHRDFAAQVDALVEQRGIYHRRRHKVALVSSALPPVRAHVRPHQRSGCALSRGPDGSVTAVLVNVSGIVPTTVSSGPGSRSRRTTGRRTRGPEPRSTDHLLDAVSITLSAHSHIAALSAQSLWAAADTSCTRITSCAVSSSAQPRDLGVSGIGHGFAPAAPPRQRRQRPRSRLMALFGQQRRIQVLPPQDRTSFRAIGAVISRIASLYFTVNAMPLCLPQALRISNSSTVADEPAGQYHPISQPRSLRTALSSVNIPLQCLIKLTERAEDVVPLSADLLGSVWAKIARTSHGHRRQPAATAVQVSHEMHPATLPRRPTELAATAAFSPAWASEIARCTPVSLQLQ